MAKSDVSQSEVVRAFEVLRTLARSPANGGDATNLPGADWSRIDALLWELTESVDVFFWICAPDNKNLIYVSPSYERIIGHSRESAYQDPMSWLESVHPQDRERAKANLDCDQANSNSQDSSYRVIGADGQLRWLWMRSWPVRDTDGTILYRVGCAVDETSRKNAEVQLKESEERFRLATEAATDAIFEGDLLTGDVWRSPLFSEFYGEEPPPDADPEWWKSRFVHPDDQERVARGFDRALQGTDTLWACEYRYRRANGEVRFASDRLFFVRDEEGKAIRFVGAVSDITEQKNIEEKLRQAVAGFRELFEFTPIPLYVYDIETYRLLAVNEATTELYGYDREDMLLLSATDLRIPDEVPRFIAELTERRGGEWYRPPREWKHVRKDGGSIDVELISHSFTYGGRPAALVAVNDITKRKATERSMIEQREQLRALTIELSLTEEQARRRLATQLHDSVSQSLVMAKMKLNQSANQIQDADLEKNIRDVLSLLAESIDQTRFLTFELSPPILYELGFVPAVRWLANETSAKHDIAIDIEIDDSTNFEMSEDVKVTLFQATRELITNVVRHANAGRARVVLDVQGGTVDVSVHDDGCGINDVSIRQNSAQHRGFGLFSIKNRLNALGGELSIRESTDGGACVALRVPRGIDHDKK